MTIILLQFVVPTLLILGVLILYINSRSKRILNEIAELRTQIETLDNVSVIQEQVPAEQPPQPEPVQEEQIEQTDTEIETQDAQEVTVTEPEASAYNTGKSGKIYTKEELESLIKE